MGMHSQHIRRTRIPNRINSHNTTIRCKRFILFRLGIWSFICLFIFINDSTFVNIMSPKCLVFDVMFVFEWQKSRDVDIFTIMFIAIVVFLHWHKQRKLTYFVYTVFTFSNSETTKACIDMCRLWQWFDIKWFRFV